ncbi:hypothetical protein JW992_01750, partial [candidate division KSB1 bacterium]|nr:hypothetical protein [candidate division KSB1 bacterium]
MWIAKEAAAALGMAIVLLSACGESPYKDLPGKAARVDSLIVQARSQGNHSLDSLQREQKLLAE